MTMALDENLAGFNINTSAANEFVLQEILDTVWPQPYIINAALKPVLNTDLITSVKVTTNPQTITYTINPKAVWQDGTPINADDFIYNWQAQSGDLHVHRRRRPALRRRRRPPATTRSPRSPDRTRPAARPATRARRPTATPGSAPTARR